MIYERGEGVVQDYGQAARCYRRAAEQGYAMGPNNLGVMNGLGDGVGDAFEQLMSKDQIAEAQQRASDCMANQYKNFRGKGQSRPGGSRWA